MSLEMFMYSGSAPGKDLLVLGAVHGNEKCGTQAIRQIMSRIESGEIVIKSGVVRFIPICNPRAYELDCRYLTEDLNRMFYEEGGVVSSYERTLAREIMQAMDRCHFVLDLHSFSSGVDAFAFQDTQDDETRSFVSALGISPIFTGWDSMYAEDNSGTTITYVNKIGKIGACIECGQHRDPHSVEVAYQAIINAMNYLGIIETDKISQPEELKRVQMHSFLPKLDGDFVKSWMNMDPVQEGEVVAVLKSGVSVKSPCSGYVIMPDAQAKAGAEWLYYGTDD